MWKRATVHLMQRPGEWVQLHNLGLQYIHTHTHTVTHSHSWNSLFPSPMGSHCPKYYKPSCLIKGQPTSEEQKVVSFTFTVTRVLWGKGSFWYITTTIVLSGFEMPSWSGSSWPKMPKNIFQLHFCIWVFPFLNRPSVPMRYGPQSPLKELCDY